MPKAPKKSAISERSMTRSSLDEFIDLVDESPGDPGTAEYYKTKISKGVDRYVREFIATVHKKTGHPNFRVNEKHTVMSSRAVFADFVSRMSAARVKVGYDAEMDYNDGKLSREEYGSYMAKALIDIAWSAMWQTYEAKFVQFGLNETKYVKQDAGYYIKARKREDYYSPETRNTVRALVDVVDLMKKIDSPDKITKTRMSELTTKYLELITMKNLDETVYLEDFDRAGVYIHKFVAMIKAFDRMLQKLRTVS